MKLIDDIIENNINKNIDIEYIKIESNIVDLTGCDFLHMLKITNKKTGESFLINIKSVECLEYEYSSIKDDELKGWIDYIETEVRKEERNDE